MITDSRKMFSSVCNLVLAGALSATNAANADDDGDADNDTASDANYVAAINPDRFYE